jgi:sugar phosphate isomerase/epimerase
LPSCRPLSRLEPGCKPCAATHKPQIQFKLYQWTGEKQPKAIENSGTSKKFDIWRTDLDTSASPKFLSITSDYVTSYGDPQPYLQRIAEAGFSHVHWCHHWDTDFLYSPAEVAQIRQWMEDYGLKTLNIHASHGREKRWDSLYDYQRLAGVELVRNRLEMAARLGADVIILHADSAYPLESQLRSLSDLEPLARLLEVRIAIENLSSSQSFQRLSELLATFSPDFLGLCYDTGHGNLVPGALGQLERMQERLIATHIHDNDGSGDEHKLPFTGSIDWGRFMRIVGSSPYDKPLNLEVGHGRHQDMPEKDFLKASYESGLQLERLTGSQ